MYAHLHLHICICMYMYVCMYVYVYKRSFNINRALLAGYRVLSIRKYGSFQRHIAFFVAYLPTVQPLRSIFQRFLHI